MHNLTIQTDLFIYGAALMLVLLGLVVAVITPSIDLWSRRFFISFYILLILYAGFGLIGEIILPYTDMRPVLEIVYFMDSLFSSLLMPMMTAYLLHCCVGKWWKSALFDAVTALWIAYFIMLGINLFTDWFYYITPENQLCRGPLYPLMMAPLAAIMVLNLIGVIRWRNRLSIKHYCAFLVEIIPITVAIVIHFFISVYDLMVIGVAICAFSMYAIIMLDQIEQYLRLQREIAHQRASIMVLQMRPHFIYNTMMSIYYLCKQDPDLAQRVTLDFTTYLRKNFTAIASEEPIPFSEELEHARAYLTVEQAQFNDSLFIDYDTPCTDFCVPPLTLQPIVENAIKHGMDQDSEPLHISIRTNRTAYGSEIIVENNGTDYEPANDSEPHIALKNVQQRLEMMCRGKMTIMPRKEGGTIVKVTIPRTI